MPYYLFFWTDDNTKHLAEHGVSPEELEVIVCDPDSVETSRSSDRLIAFGEVDGRELACVYELVDETTVYPVTAYEI